MDEWSDQWSDRQRERDERFERLTHEGFLSRSASELESVGEVAEYIALAHWNREKRGGPLPLTVAEPDTLVGRTIELAGEVGILDAQLREVMKPISSERLEVALNRLESGELIHSTKEAHADRRGTLRLRVTWTTGAATRAQETHEP